MWTGDVSTVTLIRFQKQHGLKLVIVNTGSEKSLFKQQIYYLIWALEHQLYVYFKV